ncbi:hypothetical protein Tco_0735130, partial [Tanacetum coccineum]
VCGFLGSAHRNRREERRVTDGFLIFQFMLLVVEVYAAKEELSTASFILSTVLVTLVLLEVFFSTAA